MFLQSFLKVMLPTSDHKSHKVKISSDTKLEKQKINKMSENEFEMFLNELSQKLERPLPGIPSQVKMLYGKWKDPKVLNELISSRINFSTGSTNLNPTSKGSKGPKKASVLVLLYANESGQPCFCLTQRTIYEGKFSGDICFPGGKSEQSDPSPEYTALRETAEEIGIKDTEIKVLSELSKFYSPPVDTIVYPFIGYYIGGNEAKIKHGRPPFVINEREVAEIVDVPLSELLDENNVKMMRICDIRNVKMDVADTSERAKELNQMVPCYQLQNKIVWGLTACILAELKDILQC